MNIQSSMRSTEYKLNLKITPTYGQQQGIPEIREMVFNIVKRS